MLRVQLLWCLLLFACSLLSGQKHSLIAQTVDDYRTSGPDVVFGRKGDGLPENLQVVGRVSELSFSRACGGVYWAGTLKIELLETIANYPHSSVFVVVSCLQDSGNREEYIGRVVSIEASKLYPEFREFRALDKFYFEAIENNIDSGGVPFYCTNQRGHEILKSL